MFPLAIVILVVLSSMLGSGLRPEPLAIRDLSRLAPYFRAKVEAFMEAAAEAGVVLLVKETWRSQARQDWIRAHRPTATRIKYSRHTKGIAVDLWPKRASGSEAERLLAELRPLANRHGLDNPLKWDLNHFQDLAG